MTKQLSTEELETIAKELGISPEYVTTVYAKSIEKGNPFLQQGKEVETMEEALKASDPALGGANAGDHDNGIVPETTEVPATTEVPTTEVSTTEVPAVTLKQDSLDLYDALMGLDVEEYKEFQNVAMIVQNKRETEELEELEEVTKEKGMDKKEYKKEYKKDMPKDDEDTEDEEEDMDEKDMKETKKEATSESPEFVALKEMVAAQNEAITQLTAGLTILLEAKKEGVQDVPREQATLPNVEKPETTESDEAILAALKEAEKQAPKNAQKFPLYNHFTSTRLNPGR